MNAPSSVSASSGLTSKGSSPPESVDGVTQRLDGGCNMFVDEKRPSFSCIPFLY